MADPLRNSIATNNYNTSKGDRNVDPGRCEPFHERFTSEKRKNQEKKKAEEHDKQTNIKSNTKKRGWKIWKEKKKEAKEIGMQQFTRCDRS